MFAEIAGAGIAIGFLLVIAVLIAILLTSQVLHTENRKEEGFMTRPNPDRSYLGRRGIARTNLRPTGTVEIGDERLEAFSEGDFIERGSEVLVIDVKQGKLTVRARSMKE